MTRETDACSVLQVRFHAEDLQPLFDAGIRSMSFATIMWQAETPISAR